jgi:hypothetical protein
LAWYREEDWPRLLELASDRQAIEDSHQEWLESAEKTLVLLRRQRVLVEKVIVDVEAAAEWSSEKGRPFDSAARAAFVADVASRQASAGRRRTTGCS